MFADSMPESLPGIARLARRAGHADAQRHPPGSHTGILVLRLPDQSAPAVLQAVTTRSPGNLDRLAGTADGPPTGLWDTRAMGRGVRPPPAG